MLIHLSKDEVNEGVSWEGFWGRECQAEGTGRAKALRLECACCVWSEEAIMAGEREGVRREMWVGRP